MKEALKRGTAERNIVLEAGAQVRANLFYLLATFLRDFQTLNADLHSTQRLRKLFS